MKRFHVHVSVSDVGASTRFYSRLFGSPPIVEKPDYAKWMLDDPRVNFAISHTTHAPGVNHLGIQAESGEELAELRERAAAGDLAAVPETGAACCYARSDKHWITDPQGVAWEHFHTLGSIPVFGQDSGPVVAEEACCVPLAAQANDRPQAACCVADESNAASKACC